MNEQEKNIIQSIKNHDKPVDPVFANDLFESVKAESGLVKTSFQDKVLSSLGNKKTVNFFIASVVLNVILLLITFNKYQEHSSNETPNTPTKIEESTTKMQPQPDNKEAPSKPLGDKTKDTLELILENNNQKINKNTSDDSQPSNLSGIQNNTQAPSKVAVDSTIEKQSSDSKKEKTDSTSIDKPVKVNDDHIEKADTGNIDAFFKNHQPNGEGDTLFREIK